MAYNKVAEFSAAVRRYHYYRRFGSPAENQIFQCFVDLDNPLGHFAMEVCKSSKETPIDRLPNEIPRVTMFLIDQSATVSIQLTSD